jgi:hypothetical protein
MMRFGDGLQQLVRIPRDAYQCSEVMPISIPN